MKKISVAFIVVLFLSGCSQTPEEKVDSLFQAGLDYINSGDFEKAEKSFTEIESADSTSLMILYSRGFFLEQQFLYMDAINDYYTLLNASPDFLLAREGLVRIFWRLGYFEDAVEEAVKYRKHDKSPYGLYLLARSYIKNDQLSQARQNLKKALVDGFENVDLINLSLAEINLLEGNLDSASVLFEPLLENLKSNEALIIPVAEYLANRGMVDSALAVSRRTFENDNALMPMVDHFFFALANECSFEANDAKNKMRQISNDTTFINGLNLFYTLNTDHYRNEVLLHGGQYNNTAKGGISGTFFYTKAAAITDDTRTLFETMRSWDVQFTSENYVEEFLAFYNYAAILVFVDAYANQEALFWLDKYRGVRANWPQIKVNQARITYYSGRFDEAQQALDMLEKYHGRQPDWLTALADVYDHNQIRKFDKAEELVARALEEMPSYYPAFEQYLKIFTDQNEFKNALSLFDRYPQFEKMSHRFAMDKVYYAFMADEYDLAVQTIEAHFPYLTSNDRFVTNIIFKLEKAKRFDAIYIFIKNIEKLNPQNPNLMAIIASQYADSADYDKAGEIITNAFSLSDSNRKALIQKARIDYLSGNKEAGLKLFEENNRNFRNHPDNLFYYARALSKEGEHNKATGLGRASVFASYGELKYVFNLSKLYYQMGRYDLSRGEASKVRNRERNNPYAYFYMGISWYMEENESKYKDAKEYLNKAINLGLAGEELTIAREALNNL